MLPLEYMTSKADTCSALAEHLPDETSQLDLTHQVLTDGFGIDDL